MTVAILKYKFDWSLNCAVNAKRMNALIAHLKLLFIEITMSQQVLVFMTNIKYAATQTWGTIFVLHLQNLQSIFVPTHNYKHSQASKTLILEEMSKADGVRNIKQAPKRHKPANVAASDPHEGTAAAVVKRGRTPAKTATPSRPSCTARSASRSRVVNTDFHWCTRFGRTNPHDHVPKDKCWYNISQPRYCPIGVCKAIQKYYTGKGR